MDRYIIEVWCLHVEGHEFCGHSETAPDLVRASIRRARMLRGGWKGCRVTVSRLSEDWGDGVGAELVLG